MKVESLKKPELIEYCESLGIQTKEKINGRQKTRSANDLIQAVYKYRREEIDVARENGTCLQLLEKQIEAIADKYAANLDEKISTRKIEMKQDDNSHYLIYRVLGVSQEDGQLIDIYQNTGRFLYKYAGSFLEEVASLCLFYANSEGGRKLVDNNLGEKPKTFEIDFLNGNDAIEIKWRDATTDGDHITKEHTRVKVIESYGYKPIRVMFYYPQRAQSIRIQNTLKTIYTGVGGEYHAGDDAWSYIKEVSGYDLKSILMKIAEKRDQKELV
ncbi:ApaLI family restriction endonuclease [Psychrobacter sp. FDAARGOS_221]|uniref:ApaLI family restriction endonuclease n=1 Tax=Psychrobacter sp. FDAARGOS_221 TaxID=1975705 RepID=UPI000BB5703A|nr:ApaLI family restriction endonuclease [Psychrobacter sp. FDAARGOS_221]PNK60134.1 ApaLI family restriction endonuclease [Psychrobacter sp. FDAARGOS_221]